MKYLIALFFSVQAMAFNPHITIKYDVELVPSGDKNIVDILFVIDNSGSMSAKQALLSNLAKDFIKHIEGIDYQIAAISTDDIDIISPFIISPNADSVDKLEELMIHFGVDGSPEEHVFYNIAQYLQLEQSAMLFRPFSSREIIVLTDEKEQSVDDFGEAYSWEATLKLFPESTTFNGIVPITENCWPESTATNLINIINQTKGELINICSEDESIASDYKKLGEAIAKRSALSLKPVMPVSKIKLGESIDFYSIKVSYGSQIIPRGDLQKGWVFDSFTNEILFGDRIELTTQARDSQLIIEYKSL